MNLLTSLRSEILKTRRTAAFYLTLVTAAIIPFIFFVDVCSDGVSPENREDMFNVLFKEGASMTGFVIFPMFIVLLCTLLPQIEYKNNAWKQVFASPQTKASIFIAKFLSVHLLLLVFVLANTVLMFLIAVGIHFIDPSLHLLSLPLDGAAILTKTVNTYITLLALAALQFWLGLRFKNFILPMAIGLSGWFIGAMMVMEFHSGYAVYFPYSFHVFSVFPKYESQLPSIQWTSVGYTAFFLLIGYVDFVKHRFQA